MTTTFHPEILRRLESAARRITVEQKIIDRYVQTGREAGLSWQQIGTALGITKQAAQQKYGRTTK